MRHEKHFVRFHVLVLLFVFSILLLIFSPNLMSVLLGWDGLGVTSYLLVIYFQRTKSFNAGLLTALTNRVGDVLILISIAATTIIGRWNFFMWAHAPSTWGIHEACTCLILAAACTKSAQIPFSAWLPAAIAAPTPVSSLVHSSTLVTAGVYLLFRFRDWLVCSAYLPYLLTTGALTIIIAGATALKELDIKKIVALSTLSQLGLMMTALGLGLYETAFFHLLTHAFFKALLFITVGNIIHLSRDFQDLRKIRLIEFCFPVSLSFSLVANRRLCGFPFLAGFYSKDLILELILTSPQNRWVGGLMLLAIGLTVIYTIRFVFYILCGSLLHVSALNGQDNDQNINTSMAILWPLAIAGGSGLMWLIFPSPLLVFLPGELKNAVWGVLFIATGLAGRIRITSRRLTPRLAAWSWGAMWALPLVSSPAISQRLSLCAAWARKLDLAWVASFTWAPIVRITRLGTSDKTALSSYFFKLMIVSGWFLFACLNFYLRM